MSSTQKKTKQELIEAWLAVHPNDVASLDLEYNAVAGYVRTKDGLYLPYNEWRISREDTFAEHMAREKKAR